MTRNKDIMIRTVTRRILNLSVVVSLVAQSVLCGTLYEGPKSPSQISKEHIFEITDESSDFVREDLHRVGQKELPQSPLADHALDQNLPEEWEQGWEIDGENEIDESDIETFFPETAYHVPEKITDTEEKIDVVSKKYLSDPDRLIPLDQPIDNTAVDKVLSISRVKKKKHSVSPFFDKDENNWEESPSSAKTAADISTAQKKFASFFPKKETPSSVEKVLNTETTLPPQPTAPSSLGRKIPTSDPYISLEEAKEKISAKKQTLNAHKSAYVEPIANQPMWGVFGPQVEKTTTETKEIADSTPLNPTSRDDGIIAQVIPQSVISASGQQKTPPKTILINFNNVSIIEYIRFISRITNKNFIFDENNLQFNVTIISEEPTTLENVMTALIQELRIHGLSLIEQGNNLIIHKNDEVKSISKVNVNGAPSTSPRETELVTQVFKLNTLDPGRARRIITPLLSRNSLIEISEETRHIIVTDLVTNIKEIEILFKNIDAPNSGLVIGQYVVRNAFIDNLIELSQKIMDPIAKDQSLTFVPHTSANSIFIVASPFLVERSISVLQHLDQFQGATRIYDLDELKFDQIGPKKGPPGLAGEADYSSEIPQEGIITPEFGLPGAPAIPDLPDAPRRSETPTTPARTRPQPAQPGKWEITPSHRIFRPGFPEGKEFSPSDLPQGTWGVDPQNQWYFTPEGTVTPFEREGNPPRIPGLKRGSGSGLLPGETPKGDWRLDPQGAWTFELAPQQDIKPESLKRSSVMEEELPVGHIERTKFFIHKLQFRKGQDIVSALGQIGISLQQVGSTNEDLILTIQSVQWLEASNSLVFTGTEKSISKVRELIDEIDRPLRQVFIEMLILETTMDDSLTYGVSWATRSGGGSTATAQAFLGGASPLAGAISGSGTPDASTLANSLGYNLGVIGKRLTHNGTQFASLGALVSALHSRSESNVVLSPKIITEDNKTAEIFVGINTRYQTQAVSNDEGSIVTNNYEYRDVGTTLRVTPLIGYSDIITLEIEQEVSRAGEQSSEGEGENISDISPGPTTSINRTSTTVHIPDRHFVIISGMIQDDKVSSRNQFPCLGGIPILGAAFSAKNTTDVKRNLMIFIRPQIIDTDEEIRKLTRDQQEIYKQKSRMKKGWKYEVDEGMDFLNIKPPCCDECD